TLHTGLDQLARIGIWTRLGANIIDFPYVQPPLTADQQADPNLVLAVLGTDASALSACLLHDHLERFFGISVLKGRPPADNPAAAAQLRLLRAGCETGETIALLHAGALSAASDGKRPGSLREALRPSAPQAQRSI